MINKIPKAFFFSQDIDNDKFYNACSIARIFFGLVLTHRYFDLCFSSPLDTYQTTEHFIGLFLSVFLSVGFFTPLCLPIISYFNINVSYNLASQIGAIICIILFFGRCWRNYSFDRRLVIKYKKILNVFKNIELISLKVHFLRTFAIWLWGGVCLSAVFFHLNDKSWIQGTAVMTLLRTPYLNDYYEIFNLFNTSIFLKLSAICLYLMAIWELFLWIFPGIKIIREITFWWGISFFISSILFLNLSYLPYYELIMWIIIYKPQSISKLKFQSSKIFDEGKHFYKIIKLGKRISKLIVLSGIFTISAVNVAILFKFYGNNFQRIVAQKLIFNEYATVAQHFFGQGQVNVFNQDDLNMNKYSILICRVEDKDQKTLVPFQDENGGRLDYLANDKFYYNNSLRFQRFSKDSSFENVVKMWEILSNKVVEFDLHINQTKKIKYYDIYLLENQPNFVKSYVLAGWNINKNPKIVKRLKINSENIKRYKKFRFSLPPNHFNQEKRKERTEKKYCQ